MLKLLCCGLRWVSGALAMARRIGVRAQFGDTSATNLTVSGRIGIRPQICYRSGCAVTLARRIEQTKDIENVVQRKVNYCRRPNRAVGLPLARRGEGVGGSGGKHKYIKTVANDAACIRAGGQNDLETRPGCAVKTMARRIGVRAQFGDTSARNLTVSGRIGIRPQICYRSGCPVTLARSIGVRAQFGDISATNLTGMGRIGIRPHICHTVPLFFTSSDIDKRP